ncbi:polyamine ABC transporter substrate-binding protein [Pseudomonas chlororaphis]|uniref:Polyamine ABC transporter substrate-binding protein n=1 Tax=Pseudomonas chlororaphis TaxID=587753 RepID=A0A1Q8EJ18_9PSED|nr:polyamine ABC transporter substrate-binding protein [Pseudomonas chlororaphis]OLF51782.1 polyamine ABC transporter substrate-binding protein [Pseudomonas chlororaphis]
MNAIRRFPLALALLLSCALAQAAESSVHFYNWYDYIAPDTPGQFHKETGIGVLQDTFDNSDVMQSKLMAGRSGYDVVVASSDLLPNLIKAGVLQELDRGQLGNWSHLDPEMLAKVQSNDPGNRFAAPYLWGTTGIGYDADKVKALLGDQAAVDSWDLIFKEENLAKLSQCGVAMLDAPGEIIPIALHYLGLPYNSQDPEDYKKAEALLLKVRPYIRYFDSSKFITDLANGNICVVVGWSGGVFDAQVASQKAGNGRRLIYSIPREGGPVWVENLVLLKDAPHPQDGLKFIDYLLRPEVIAQSSDYLGYPNANKDATALVEQKIRDNRGVYPSREVLATLFPLEPLPLKMERIRTRAWSKVKTGS